MSLFPHHGRFEQLPGQLGFIVLGSTVAQHDIDSITECQLVYNLWGYASTPKALEKGAVLFFNFLIACLQLSLQRNFYKVLFTVFHFQNRYVCAVTNDVLGNSVPCAVLRPS